MTNQVNLDPLEPTAALPYLGRTVEFNNSYWASLYGNLRKEQWIWGVVEKIPTNKEATVQVWEMMYKAVVHKMLLYGSESWAVME